MLTSDQKNQIRLEEIFRSEVRGQLNKRSGAARILASLNQPFSLWVLSTIVIGLVTFAYNIMSEHQKRQAARDSRITAIDLELAGRFRTLHLMLESVEDSVEEGEFGESYISASFLLAISDIGAFQQQSQQNAPAGAERRTLTSLLWELKGLVAENERQEIIDAIAMTEHLNEIALRGTMASFSGFGGIEFQAEDTAKMLLLSEAVVDLARWKNLSGRSEDIQRARETTIKSLESKIISAQHESEHAQALEDDPTALSWGWSRETGIVERIEEARAALRLFELSNTTWRIEDPPPDRSQRPVYLTATLRNNSGREVVHAEFDIVAFDEAEQIIVSSGGAVHFPTALPDGELVVTHRMDTGVRQSDVASRGLGQLASALVIAYPTKIVYADGSEKEHGYISLQDQLSLMKELSE